MFSTNQGEGIPNFGHWAKGMEASPVDNGEQPKASTSLRLVRPLKPLCPSSTSPNLLSLHVYYSKHPFEKKNG